MNQNLFESLPIDPQILRAIGEMGFSEPNPVPEHPAHPRRT